ncbi:helix-turn-helix domain-containing protein [Methanofollis ethanolicus]|uniref:helix-turn-helix domain-containing protein n=1 Tax=Methanofollis ethanolicus TaxID=488124 RepID=UPI000830313F|nr:helix-turn-helix domain-containing protein [Methanofollis ethanolicus]
MDMQVNREQLLMSPGCDDGIKRILCLLEEETHGLSISDISRTIDLNRNSVAKYLNMLVVAGRVEMQVVGSARVYRLAVRFPVSTLFPFLPDPAVTVGSDLRVRHVNAHFCALFGMREDEIVGAPVSETPCAILRFLTDSGYLEGAVRGKRDGGGTWHPLAGECGAYVVWTVPAVFEDGDYGAIAAIRPA